ncbi:conserved protein of unknown function [Ruminococcaceae bacterium BL-6]|nr:conserved protein of unknown function [Ruminococcaceae bacterium BL-6]
MIKKVIEKRYVCRKSQPGTWIVGSYDPQGYLVEESSWNSAAEAVEHLHHLLSREAGEGGEEDTAPKA